MLITTKFIDYIYRFIIYSSLADELQGRAWGMIGFLSQIGYVVAYAVSGIAADKIAMQFEFGVGRGAAGVIVLSGIFLSITALFLYSIKSVKMLERGAYD